MCTNEFRKKNLRTINLNTLLTHFIPFLSLTDVQLVNQICVRRSEWKGVSPNQPTNRRQTTWQNFPLIRFQTLKERKREIPFIQSALTLKVDEFADVSKCPSFWQWLWALAEGGYDSGLNPSDPCWKKICIFCKRIFVLPFECETILSCLSNPTPPTATMIDFGSLSESIIPPLSSLSSLPNRPCSNSPSLSLSLSLRPKRIIHTQVGLATKRKSCHNSFLRFYLNNIPGFLSHSKTTFFAFCSSKQKHF